MNRRALLRWLGLAAVTPASTVSALVDGLATLPVSRTLEPYLSLEEVRCYFERLNRAFAEERPDLLLVIANEKLQPGQPCGCGEPLTLADIKAILRAAVSLDTSRPKGVAP